MIIFATLIFMLLTYASFIYITRRELRLLVGGLMFLAFTLSVLSMMLHF